MLRSIDQTHDERVTVADTNRRWAWSSMARPEVAVTAVLLAIAVSAWVATDVRMAGMDTGPWTYPTHLGSYINTWIVMMAAMMFPSIVPMALTFENAARDPRTQRTAFARTGVFVSGYLAVWSAAGLLGFAILKGGGALDSGLLGWFGGGRYLAAGVLLGAAAYEFTPPKSACLTRCSTRPTWLRERCHGGAIGAVRMGVEAGAWCLGCCWTLMAALFALGVMSLPWMILISTFITVEKLLPTPRLGTVAVACVLAALTIGLLVAPAGIPGLTIPVHGSAPM